MLITRSLKLVGLLITKLVGLLITNSLNLVGLLTTKCFNLVASFS